ncbi:hypothetical protein EON83_11205 [bacterium]|nr:MAG: hypothetical protein EON83_11205 [bacterium]
MFWTKTLNWLRRFGESVGEMWGEFLIQTVRGFEFALSVGTINNAVVALQMRSDGLPVASYLRGQTPALCLPAACWAALFAIGGTSLLLLWFASMPAGGFTRHLHLRAIAHGALSLLYTVVSIEVVRRSDAPPLVGRYLLTLLLALCCTVLLLRLIWNGNASRRFKTKLGVIE